MRSQETKLGVFPGIEPGTMMKVTMVGVDAIASADPGSKGCRRPLHPLIDNIPIMAHNGGIAHTEAEHGREN